MTQVLERPSSAAVTDSQ